jgi:hypothetical protein
MIADYIKQVQTRVSKSQSRQKVLFIVRLFITHKKKNQKNTVK